MPVNKKQDTTSPPKPTAIESPQKAILLISLGERLYLPHNLCTQSSIRDLVQTIEQNHRFSLFSLYQPWLYPPHQLS